MRTYTVTNAGISAEDDRHRRMRVYFIMMSIRMACVASLLFLRGWWILLAVIGGVFLPYVAVLIANAPDHRAGRKAQTPEPLQLTSAEATPLGEQSTPIIVIDDPAERRSNTAHPTGAQRQQSPPPTPEKPDHTVAGDVSA